MYSQWRRFCQNDEMSISVVTFFLETGAFPGSKVHGASMGPTWVLSAPDEPHVVPMNLAIRVTLFFLASARGSCYRYITDDDGVRIYIGPHSDGVNKHARGWFRVHDYFFNAITSALPETATVIYSRVLIWYFTIQNDTGRCRYNAVHFLQIPYKRNIIAQQLGRDMGCFCGLKLVIYILVFRSITAVLYVIL